MWHLLMAHQQESFHPFSSRQSLSCFLSHVAKGSTLKPCGPDSRPSRGVPPLAWLLCLGLNPSASLPLQPHFRLLPQCYICQQSRILPALLGCHSKSGEVWPHGMEPIFSKVSHRCCNQGQLLPSYILDGSQFHPPGSKRGHSYLTYPLKQVKGYRYVK